MPNAVSFRQNGGTFKSIAFFARIMSRPPSILVTRTEPTLKGLEKRYRREKDADKVRRIGIIVLMLRLKNAERVAELMGLEADTVRAYVEAFNEGGLEGLYKKKVQDEDLSSPETSKLS
jgi:hypothetical protein